MKTVKIALFSFSLLAAPAMAGIPVIDPAAIAQAVIQVQHMLTQIEEAKNQVTEAKKQVEEAKQQTEILTSQNTYKDFARESAQDLVPEDWQALYDLTNVDVNYLNDASQYDPDGSAKNLAKMDELMAKSNQGLFQQAQALEALLNELNSPAGIKDSADLQNRIAVQQLALSLNQTTLDQMYRQHEIQGQVLDRQRQAHELCVREQKANDFEGFSYAKANDVCGGAR